MVAHEPIWPKIGLKTLDSIGRLRSVLLGQSQMLYSSTKNYQFHCFKIIRKKSFPNSLDKELQNRHEAKSVIHIFISHGIRLCLL